MGALWIEALVVTGMVGMKPEGRLSVRLEFDEAGLVVSALHFAHVMLSDVEATANRFLCRVALRHDNVRLQDA